MNHHLHLESKTNDRKWLSTLVTSVVFGLFHSSFIIRAFHCTNSRSACQRSACFSCQSILFLMDDVSPNRAKIWTTGSLRMVISFLEGAVPVWQDRLVHVTCQLWGLRTISSGSFHWNGGRSVENSIRPSVNHVAPSVSHHCYTHCIIQNRRRSYPTQTHGLEESASKYSEHNCSGH